MDARRKREQILARRRRRRMIAYTLRVFVGVFLGLAIYLMLCGFLYLQKTFFGGEGAMRAQAAHLFDSSFGEESEQSGENGYPYGDFSREKDLVIVLDAGHGGKDCGTLSGKVQEKDITLAVTKKIQEKLEKKNVTVVMTRSTDDFVDLKDRAKIANDAKADLFVSLHCNYYEKSDSVKGLECYYMEGAEEGRRLAEEIVKSLEKEKKVDVRNAKSADYSVLRNTSMPAVLIELGYLSNREEGKKLTQSDYQELLAEELVRCLLE